MAYTASDMHLNPVAPGRNVYMYQTTDTMATVLPKFGGGYFTYFPGTTSGPAFAANDLIFCQCADGNMWVKVHSVNASTGAVYCQFAGGDLPIRTWATGTAAGDFGMSVGLYEVGSDTGGTGSRATLPVPYPGAQVRAIKVGSGTNGVSFCAGASASGVSWVDYPVGGSLGGSGATTITFDGSNRRILLQAEGDWFHAVGSSLTRYRLYGYFFQGSAVSEGASVELSTDITA